MATRAGVGFSTRRDATEAGRAAAGQAVGAIDGEPDLLLVFATAGYDQPAVVRAAHGVAPRAALSGCSGEGIIAGSVTDEGDRSVGVMAIRSDRLAFDAFLIPDYAADAAAAGRELARQVDAASRDDAFGLLVMPDGLLGNCGEMLAALDASLASPLTVVGGTAGDALTFERSFQYMGDEVASGATAAVLLRGAGRIDLAVSHGCVPIGLPRKVTNAEGGWLREIDGLPAWSVFREYLQGNPSVLNLEGAIHISLGEELPRGAEGEHERLVVHTPLGLDQASGALFFPGGGLRTGAAIRLARRDPDRIRESGRACAARIAGRHGGRRPAFVLQFDCAGRGRQLFGSSVAEAILHPLQSELGDDVPWIGFHTYGEIAPLGGATHYHNFTVALTAIYEDA
jgi:hypothetical protein